MEIIECENARFWLWMSNAGLERGSGWLLYLRSLSALEDDWTISPAMRLSDHWDTTYSTKNMRQIIGFQAELMIIFKISAAQPSGVTWAGLVLILVLTSFSVSNLRQSSAQIALVKQFHQCCDQAPISIVLSTAVVVMKASASWHTRLLIISRNALWSQLWSRPFVLTMQKRLV